MDTRELTVVVDMDSDGNGGNQPEKLSVTSRIFVVVAIIIAVLWFSILGWFTAESLLSSAECYFCDFTLGSDEVWRDVGYTCPDCGERQPDLFSGHFILHHFMLEVALVFIAVSGLVILGLSAAEHILKREFSSFRIVAGTVCAIGGFIWCPWYCFTMFFSLWHLVSMMFSSGMVH